MSQCSNKSRYENISLTRFIKKIIFFISVYYRKIVTTLMILIMYHKFYLFCFIYLVKVKKMNFSKVTIILFIEWIGYSLFSS